MGRIIRPTRLPSEGMRNGAVAVVLVVAILTGAGAGYLVGSTTQRTITSTSISTSTLPVITQTSTIQLTITSFSTVTTTSYTPIVTAGCVIPSDLYLPLFAPASINSSQRGQLAIVMSPNSNAIIFVGYCPYETAGPVTLSPLVNVMSCYTTSGGGGCSATPATGVTITAIPNQTVFENQSLTIVAYQISANIDSTGYYAIGIPNSCPSIGLAVGHPASQLNHANFPWMGPIPCPLTFGGIIYIAGANTTYVGLG
jgi:hypothetical protein